MSRSFPTSTHARTTRVRLESLEDRCVPTVYLYNNDLYVTGTSGNDVADVFDLAGWGSSGYLVTFNGSQHIYTVSQVPGGEVFFLGYEGNDTFSNRSNLRGIAFGYDGNDVLVGGNNVDYLDGGNGSDTLLGGAGNDWMVAGADTSVNYLDGGYGGDWLLGGLGNDTLIAGYDYNPNAIYANSGNDLLIGGYGNDFLRGEGDSDAIYGLSGIDYLHGGAGDDLLNGGDDGLRDYLYGEGGNNWFQTDWFLYAGIWYNLDYPQDFNSSTDTFFN